MNPIDWFYRVLPKPSLKDQLTEIEGQLTLFGSSRQLLSDLLLMLDSKPSDHAGCSGLNSWSTPCDCQTVAGLQRLMAARRVHKYGTQTMSMLASAIGQQAFRRMHRLERRIGASELAA